MIWVVGGWTSVPLHLIGHSRGGSVVSRLAYRLGGTGIWVDHVTTLDPQPITTCGDFQVGAWENVLFADNYYRDSVSKAGAPPYGEPIVGTYERSLNGIVTGDGYQCSDLVIPWFNGTAH